MIVIYQPIDFYLFFFIFTIYLLFHYLTKIRNCLNTIAHSFCCIVEQSSQLTETTVTTIFGIDNHRKKFKKLFLQELIKHRVSALFNIWLLLTNTSTSTYFSLYFQFIFLFNFQYHYYIWNRQPPKKFQKISNIIFWILFWILFMQQ